MTKKVVRLAWKVCESKLNDADMFIILLDYNYEWTAASGTIIIAIINERAQCVT